MDLCSVSLICFTAYVISKAIWPDRCDCCCNDDDDDDDIAKFRVGEIIREDMIISGCWHVKGKGFVYAIEGQPNVEYRESSLESLNYDD